jgi:hypothetical protein
MLFFWDNGGRIHHRSTSSRGPEHAARSSYGFANLVTRCLSSPPFLPIVPANNELRKRRGL